MCEFPASMRVMTLGANSLSTRISISLNALEPDSERATAKTAGQAVPAYAHRQLELSLCFLAGSSQSLGWSPSRVGPRAEAAGERVQHLLDALRRLGLGVVCGRTEVGRAGSGRAGVGHAVVLSVQATAVFAEPSLLAACWAKRSTISAAQPCRPCSTAAAVALHHLRRREVPQPVLGEVFACGGIGHTARGVRGSQSQPRPLPLVPQPLLGAEHSIGRRALNTATVLLT